MNTFANRKLILVSLAVFLTVGLVATAQAQRPGGGPGHRGDCDRSPESRLEQMTARLDLTADQVQAIKKIHEEGRAQNLELRKEIMRLRNEKRGELLQDEPATKTVLALTKKIGELRTEMQTRRMENRLAVRKLLTPEQRDKMLMSGQGHGRRGHRGGPGRDGGACDGAGPHRGPNGGGRGVK